MITITRLARQFDLSRSTLLYYDRIGLLRPSGRSAANYRLYTMADRQRLEKICHYRQIGLPLKEIGNIIDSPGERTGAALEHRLLAIDRQIRSLRNQARVIRGLLGNPNLSNGVEGMDRDKWTTLLRASGMSDEDMIQWHIEFEHLFPDDHQDFLKSLGIPPDEIRAIRGLARD